MVTRHLSRADLQGKVVDVHSHIGVGIGGFLCEEYPYAQTAEGLYYRQLAGNVDANVVFPFPPDLSFDLSMLKQGKKVLAKAPLSFPPYSVENRMLMREVFDYCPELSQRFIPFISLDPGRYVAEQLESLEQLEQQYPIYGIKVHPVGCLSHATKLLQEGEPFLDFAQDRDIPFLFHATTLPGDEYSQASDLLKIAAARPQMRFCLAHCLLFSHKHLEAANQAHNVWVDTSALKIQVDLVQQSIANGALAKDSLLDADYSDFREVMRTLCETYPNTILWGTDSPAYAYHCRRQQGDGIYRDFALKGRYEDEIAALLTLPEKLRQKVSNANTLDFLFGRTAS